MTPLSEVMVIPLKKLKAPFGLDQTFALVFVGLPRLQYTNIVNCCSLFVKELNLSKRVRSTLGVKWADLVNKGACTLLVRDCPYGSGGECTGYNICFHYHLLLLIWYLFSCRRHRPSNLIEDESRTPSQEFFLSLEREHAKISPQVGAFSLSWVELMRMNC